MYLLLLFELFTLKLLKKRVVYLTFHKVNTLKDDLINKVY